jgi:hypothetical protein
MKNVSGSRRKLSEGDEGLKSVHSHLYTTRVTELAVFPVILEVNRPPK